MPVTYTNRKGVSYTLYKGETKTGKPRYYSGRSGEGQGKPVEKLPPGFTISESVNGIVSLVKDRPLLIQPEEVAAVEAVLKRHPKARRYRISVKSKWIEVYENSSPDIEPLLRRLGMAEQLGPGRIAQVQAEQEHHAQYAPVLRFTLLDPIQREFGVERMCYRGSIDGWLELMQTGYVGKVARAVIPTLGTDRFFELM